jgi:hypothetical protein
MESWSHGVMESWSHGVMDDSRGPGRSLRFGVLGGRSAPRSERANKSITPLLHYSITPELLNSFFKGIHQNSGENRVEPDLV